MNDVGVSQEDKTMGLIAHLSGLVTIGPLIVWLINKDKPEKAFVTRHALEATNFIITLWIVMIGLVILTTILGFIPLVGIVVGLVMMFVFPLIGLASVVLLIMAGMKANSGEDYRYPFNLRLIK